MKNLQDLRRKNKLTIRQVAILLDTTTTTVSRWENGKRMPSINFLPKMIEIYKTSFDEIYQAVMASAQFQKSA